MKRIFDFTISLVALIILSPIIAIFCLLIFLQDYSNPFYVAPRVGINERPFMMIKLRSMIVNADKSGVDSTANDDMRITKVGAMVRRYKLDELTQLLNVVTGDMSLVGPRPNVKRETDLYTREEKRLLAVRPGITDFASIVFSDEGDILEGQSDPDLAYNQLIRPGKGFLGLFYIENRSLAVDIRILFLTALAIVDKQKAIDGVVTILAENGAEPWLVEMASRNAAPTPLAPPGASNIVTDRESVPV